MELSEERVTTAGELKRVRELEHHLERAESCLSVERADREELDWRCHALLRIFRRLRRR